MAGQGDQCQMSQVASPQVSAGTYRHHAEDRNNDSLTDKLLTHLNVGQYKGLSKDPHYGVRPCVHPSAVGDSTVLMDHVSCMCLSVDSLWHVSPSSNTYEYLFTSHEYL